MSNLQLTLAGERAIEAAYQAGDVVTITEVGIGDAGGVAANQNPELTALVGEFGREPFSAGGVDDVMIGGEIVIESRKYPAKVIRELGLFSDENVLIAYGVYPDTYLPEQADTILKEIIIRFALALSHTECVTVVVDPTLSILTRDEGDARYLNESENLADVDDIDASRENLGCGTAATFNAQTSIADSTRGTLMVNGAWGIGTDGLIMRDSDILSPTSIGNAFFVQGGGADNHFGSYGAGVHLSYGTGGGNTVRLSANLFVDDTGNLSVEWLEINISDGSVKNKKLQKLYGPFNKPHTDDINAIAQDVCNVAGFVSGDKTKPYMRHKTSNAVIELLTKLEASEKYQPKGSYTPEGEAYTKAESNARYVQGIQLGAETRISGDKFSSEGVARVVKVPAGCTMTSIGDTNASGNLYLSDIDFVGYKPIQRNINGVWVTISG